MKSRLVLVLLAVLLVLAGWCLANLGKYLSTPTQIPHKADLIVILGGDTGARSLKGAELYRSGMAPVVLLTGLDEGEKETLPHYLHWRCQLLQSKGVAADVLLFDDKSENSWQEAQNTLNLMSQKGWQWVIVVSDPPHMRRLDWVWGNAFAGSGKNYQLIAAMPSWWQRDSWWANERSAKFVINEAIKLVYYRLKYSF